jgi:hypothetical protein
MPSAINFQRSLRLFKRFPTLFEKNQWPDGLRERSCESREINLGLSYFGTKENFRYEVLLGGGLGDMTFNSLNNDHTMGAGYNLGMRADKWNAFIQPNFSYKINNRLDKHLALAVFTKFNSVNYYNVSVNRQLYDAPTAVRTEEQVYDLEPRWTYDEGLVYFSSHEKSNLFFIEPGIFVKGGGTYFKGTMQISYVVHPGGPALYYQPYSINLGCSINFNLLDLIGK